MKVSITEDSKRIITLSELEAAREIVRDMKEDTSTAAEYAAMAVRQIFGACGEVFSASAEICKNNKAWNRYSDNSGQLDIWVRFFARVDTFKIVEGGACLSDIWDEAVVERNNCFILEYTRK